MNNLKVIGMKMYIKSNSVSNKIPAHVDRFLQDIAQMYDSDLKYSHIMDHNYTKSDISKLISLSRAYYKSADQLEDDVFETWVYDEVIPRIHDIFGIQ